MTTCHEARGYEGEATAAMTVERARAKVGANISRDLVHVLSALERMGYDLPQETTEPTAPTPAGVRQILGGWVIDDSKVVWSWECHTGLLLRSLVPSSGNDSVINLTTYKQSSNGSSATSAAC